MRPQVGAEIVVSVKASRPRCPKRNRC